LGRALKTARPDIKSASTVGKTRHSREKALDAAGNPPNSNCIVTVWAGGPQHMPIPPAD
jgi:hypothetical protein